MSESRGLCVISIPKSGTMFLSRYLERVTGRSVVFGLEQRSAQQLAHEMRAGWDPAILSAAGSRCVSTRIMCRRYAQMLARNRAAAKNEQAISIFSDHGHTNFLQFLINPALDQILDPRALIRWASDRQLATVFLYRELSAVANSLALFLASGKSFLLSLRSVEEAAALVVKCHAPVLAAQTALWLQAAAENHTAVLSYDELIAEPAHWIRKLAQLGNLSCNDELLHNDASAYRSWTYRNQNDKDKASASWRDTFNSEQQAALSALSFSREVPQ